MHIGNRCEHDSVINAAMRRLETPAHRCAEVAMPRKGYLNKGKKWSLYLLPWVMRDYRTPPLKDKCEHIMMIIFVVAFIFYLPKVISMVRKYSSLIVPNRFQTVKLIIFIITNITTAICFTRHQPRAVEGITGHRCI